tara:strand:- start:70 stop:282 length:213 start_codon:yes stop_codon:yes gene_type:complete
LLAEVVEQVPMLARIQNLLERVDQVVVVLVGVILLLYQQDIMQLPTLVAVAVAAVALVVLEDLVSSLLDM